MSSVPAWQPISAVEDEWFWDWVAAVERLLAAAFIVVLSPMLGAIWVLTLALSGRSPLIAHRRVGRNGSELWVLKFRTMWERPGELALRRAFSIEYIDDESGPALKCACDARVASRFAQFCRQHSLDELPQLIHVVLGQMSLIGPRPVTRGELNEIYGCRAEEILRVRPGISGLWQVSGRNRLTAAERCALDLECVRRRSLRFYFAVLLRTIPEIFNGAGAW